MANFFDVFKKKKSQEPAQSSIPSGYPLGQSSQSSSPANTTSAGTSTPAHGSQGSPFYPMPSSSSDSPWPTSAERSASSDYPSPTTNPVAQKKNWLKKMLDDLANAILPG